MARQEHRMFDVLTLGEPMILLQPDAPAALYFDERNTSKMCSGCGNVQAMPLWKRTYCCGECGLVMDRDENRAHNILTRFFARRGPYTQARPECDVLQATQSGVEVIGTSCEGQVQQLNLFECV